MYNYFRFRQSFNILQLEKKRAVLDKYTESLLNQRNI